MESLAVPDPGSSGYHRATQRTQRRILTATGDLLRLDPSQATMAAIAERAEVSLATAYRYYPTLASVHGAYLNSVAEAVRDFSLACSRSGTDLFDEVARHWADLVSVYGAAMVEVRSREGFLSRLRGGDSIIGTIRETWDRPIREVLVEFGVDDSHFEYALMIYNALFDPREILDLLECSGSPPDHDVLSDHIRVYYAALRGLPQRGRR